MFNFIFEVWKITVSGFYTFFLVLVLLGFDFISGSLRLSDFSDRFYCPGL
jgi:hypothetical protein